MINLFLNFIQTEVIENGIQWFDRATIQFLLRFAINIISVSILIRFIYFRNYRRTDMFLTYFGINVIIFLITYLVNKVEMSMGTAFGLFAVFSMLRYRTEGISAKDMTYLFLVIATGLITAISNGSWYELSIMCAILLLSIGLLEANFFIKKEITKEVVFDKIDLIHASKYQELLKDLQNRLGLPVHRVEINDVDLIKDAANITIFYYR
jgi:hypothetical protein